MNEDAPKPPREELETRLTALLLGELPAEEAAALREIIAKDAQLAGLHERLKRAIDLVRETAARPMEQTAAQPAPLKLSDERRQKLLAHFKTVAPEQFRAPRGRGPSWFVPLGAAAAAALMLLAAIAIPNFTRARTTSRANVVINNLRRLDSAKQQWALENKKSATDVPTLSDLEPYMGRGGEGSLPSVMGETYKLGSVSEEVTAELDAARAGKSFGGLAAKLPAGGVRGELAHLSVNGELTFVDKNADQKSLDDRLKRESEASNPKQASAPGNLAPKGVNRTEIVLPSGGEFASAANPQFETRSASVDRDAFRQRLAEVKSLAASGAGGIGGGGGAGGGGGVGGSLGDQTGTPIVVQEERAGRDIRQHVGNPDWVGILDANRNGADGSKNRFITRNPLALTTAAPPGEAPAQQPAPPSQPPVNSEAKFLETGQSDAKALGFDWEQSKREIRVQGGTAPALAGKKPDAKLGIRDSNSDVLAQAVEPFGDSSVNTFAGRKT